MAGCGGSGTLRIVPLNQSRIEKTEPLIVSIGPLACWYAVDDERITIGFERENFSLIGGYGKRVETASIVVDGLPAHKARDYKINRTSVRGRVRSGAQHLRFASTGGILALWFEPDGRLKGRIRSLAKTQQFNVVMGWSGDARALLVGDFTAVLDPQRSEAIRRRSEADGLERDSSSLNPASEPAAGPSPRAAEPRDPAETPDSAAGEGIS